MPGVSAGLKNAFKKSGCRDVFKSNKNLGDILTMKNKPRLPSNSHPGVYKVDCSCGEVCVGEAELRVATRINRHGGQHSFLGQCGESAVADHTKGCGGIVKWDSEQNAVEVGSRCFGRRVREALGIQYRQYNPRYGGINRDDGTCVTTSFWRPLLGNCEGGCHCEEKTLGLCCFVVKLDRGGVRGPPRYRNLRGGSGVCLR